MARPKVVLDRAAIRLWLQTVPAPTITRIAEAIGAQARAQTTQPVYVNHMTTDRAHSEVSVPADLQARTGVLTRGAAAQGLEVRSRARRS